MRREINISTGDETEFPDDPPTPELPVDLSAIDQANLNAALVAEGSVVRAIGEVLYGVIKGTIPVTPSLTKPQFVAMLKAKMRS